MVWTQEKPGRNLQMNNLNDIFFAQITNEGLTYDQILEDVQRYFAEHHASTLSLIHI